MRDIDIAQRAELRPIVALAEERLGIPADALDPYGHTKAKLSLSHIAGLEGRPDGRLILVTAITPTPAGEGKTTTTVGLGDALNRLGHDALICLREPSLGPCFGIKGGAAGGGRAQVVPMEDINLHFTGDLHAIGAAHNLLAAMLDNHIHHGNRLGIDARRVQLRRVVDMNDRALRHTVVGLGGPGNGFPREDGHDIVVASEVMAILCLARSLEDLRERLGAMVVAHARDGEPVHARDLKAHGAMAALLKDAIRPNLVQTLENNPAFIHGGPFANIAHGCNSVMATRTALKLADYVVTEAGFGADLGAEKFFDIKCRTAGLAPDGAVLVATVRALKYHGGVAVGDLATEDVAAVERGMVNLERHLENLREVFGMPCVVAVNHFVHDTEAEIATVLERVRALGAEAVVARHWAEGGAGAEALAEAVVAMVERGEAALRHPYPLDAPLWEKIEAVARRVYRAGTVTAPSRVREQIARFDERYRNIPVCIAKTQYSFSADPSLRGAPSDFPFEVREVRISNGAGFLVAICGDIMTMPGLPREPAAEHIDIDAEGRISGLF